MLLTAARERRGERARRAMAAILILQRIESKSEISSRTDQNLNDISDVMHGRELIVLASLNSRLRRLSVRLN